MVESTEWRRAIEAVDAAVIEHLRDIGFDEARYESRIGFGKLKWCVDAASSRHWHTLHDHRSSTAHTVVDHSCEPDDILPAAGRYLEEELQRRYRDAAPSTLTVLQQRCELVAAELAAAEQNLANASDVPALRRAGACARRLQRFVPASSVSDTHTHRATSYVTNTCEPRAAMRHVSGISRHVRELLDGAMDPPPEVFGSTTVEEHAACSFPRVGAVAEAVGNETL